VFRVALTWIETTSGQIAVNVIHTLHAGSTAAAEAAVVDAAAPTTMQRIATSGAIVQDIAVTPLDGTSATVHRATTGGGWGGQMSGDWIPNASPVISLQTGLRGRSHRGRVYLPFCAETAISDGRLVSPNSANLVTSWIAFQANLVSAGSQLVVASYKTSSAHAVTGITCLAAVGTQRRRQTRVRYP
jgi:hypothetical protein